MSRLQPLRGMRDLLPPESSRWHHVEMLLAKLAGQFGYLPIRPPILESTEVFKRSIGESTDIVSKEMYTFEDRSGDSLTLRPEGTAQVVRAGISQGLFRGAALRLWYTGPMFRYERPQKGRNRQFYQFGVETFGFASPAMDVEVMAYGQAVIEALGLGSLVTLEINSLGTTACRDAYRKALVSYFEANIDALDEDSQRRLTQNPLRILDSKNPEMSAVIQNAPKLVDYLSEEAKAHFNQVTQMLDHLEIAYEINDKLVRGLDYYTHTVFEWTTEALGSQGAVGAGGRYDRLVAQMGGPDTPAVGLGMGLDRLLLLLETVAPAQQNDADIFIATQSTDALPMAAQLAQSLRAKSDVRVLMGLEGSLKSQMKRADKSGAIVAFVLGEDEVTSQSVVIKPLRDKSLSQETVSVSELSSWLEANQSMFNQTSEVPHV